MTNEEKIREKDFFHFFSNYGKLDTAYDPPERYLPIAIKVCNCNHLLSYFVESIDIKKNVLYVKVNKKNIRFEKFIKEYYVLGFNNKECLENPDVDYIKFNSLLRKDIIKGMDCFSKIMGIGGNNDNN